MSNKLINETSPYLLQHADNPVQWHAWNSESLQKAKDENKPIFLSVGYSSCHWCHVMAHESFENIQIAEIMNKNFINIKVDREERPDIDDVYQKACQMTTGQGGWPLSVFLTPDQKPFYIGTYFPPNDFHSRPGFASILLQMAQGWREKPNDIKSAAEKITSIFSKNLPTSQHVSLNELMNKSANFMMQIADYTFGGFGTAPKFPNSLNMSFLFRYSKLTKIPKYRDFALHSLKKMASGGMYDHIRGGFHRYSTDQKWLVPHFEKMLYDNALILLCYIEAFQITKDPFYYNTTIKTLQYIIQEMTTPDGGFCSAQDADSIDGEGVYYTWTKKEIKQILGKDADVFCTYYGVTDGGNFEARNIIHHSVPLPSVAFQENLSQDQILKILETSKTKLLIERQKRSSPQKDDKIITSWNALMISTFAKSFRITNNKEYLDIAINCLEFIDSNLIKNGVLMRSFKDGRTDIAAYLEDYTFLIAAILDIFEVDPKLKYLTRAIKLTEFIIENFWDVDKKYFYMTSKHHDVLIIRPYNNYDLSIPSGNSVALDVLQRLYSLTNIKKFDDIFTQILESQMGMAADNPLSFPKFLITAYTTLQKRVEIILLNKNSSISKYLRESFLPESIFVEINDQQTLESLDKYSFFANKKFSDDDDKSIVYVCKDSVCTQPLDNIQDVKQYC